MSTWEVSLMSRNHANTDAKLFSERGREVLGDRADASVCQRMRSRSDFWCDNSTRNTIRPTINSSPDCNRDVSICSLLTNVPFRDCRSRTTNASSEMLSSQCDRLAQRSSRYTSASDDRPTTAGKRLSVVLLRGALDARRISVTFMFTSQPHRSLSKYSSNWIVFFNTCKSHVESLDLERESLVIDSQTMQDRGVHVVDVDRVADDVVAKIVRLTVDDTRLDPSPRHPNGEATRVMVPAVVFASKSALAIDRASKFATPDNQRIVK